MASEPEHPQTDPLTDRKHAIRNRMRAHLAAMPPSLHASTSVVICERLLDSVYFAASRVVLAYAPLPTEVDITQIALAVLGGNRTLLIPRVDWEAGSMAAANVAAWPSDLVTGRYGIREPAAHLPSVPVNSIDMVLVPGLAFDLKGGRLGRGAGFYDRFLAGTNAVKIGLAFESQIVERVPMRLTGEIPDVCMDAVLTEQRTVIGCPIEPPRPH